MKVPDIALLIVLVVFSIIFGAITLVVLWYFVAFVIELACSVGWWVMVFGAAVLVFNALVILAAGKK